MSEAGPSKTTLFFAPPDPDYRQPTPINPVGELLSLFNLKSAYDRQLALASRSALAEQQARPQPPDLKRKLSTPNQAPDGPLEDAKKKRKQEKESYKSLFRNMPGKLDSKRDRYLCDLMAMPERNISIVPLDDTLVHAAFTIHDLSQPPDLMGDDDAKKKKKKRKRENDLPGQANDPSATPFTSRPHPSSAPTPAAHLPTPGGTAMPTTPWKTEPNRGSIQTPPMKRRRQDNYPLQQPTPQGV